MKDFIFGRVFLTRECSLNCYYCKVVKEKKDILPLDSWKNIFNTLRDLVMSFNILGGDPVLYPDFFRLVNWLNEEDINYTAALTGLYISEEVKRQMLLTSYKGVSVSIDGTQDSHYLDKFSKIKSIYGYDFIGNVIAKNKIVGITVGRNNILAIVDLVKQFSDKGWMSCVNPCQYKKKEFRMFSGGKKEFTAKDFDLLNEVGNNLLSLKKQGYLLTGVDYIYQNWFNLFIKQDWKCLDTPSIFIDSDGSVGCCWDYRGKRVSKWSISEILCNINQFRQDYQLDVQEGCSGCSWESQIVADRIKLGLEVNNIL